MLYRLFFIFQDIHMDVLNGHDATKRIRKLLPLNEQPWIIGKTIVCTATIWSLIVFPAVTASSLPEDLDEAAEAGMVSDNSLMSEKLKCVICKYRFKITLNCVVV
jgi:CheY-like chemotaxis protein